LESAAYHAQPDWARSVLFAMAARCNGHNNGDLSLTFSEAKRLGIAAQWKLYAGLRLLERAELVVCTRRGRLERGTKLASLFALTWRGIDKCERVHFDPGITPCPLPTHAWAKWVRPADWTAIRKQIVQSNRGRSKIPHTQPVGNGRSQRGGAIRSNIAPSMLGKELALVAPSMVETSKTLGRGTPSGYK
jgi:hypothetical protein